LPIWRYCYCRAFPFGKSYWLEGGTANFSVGNYTQSGSFPFGQVESPKLGPLQQKQVQWVPAWCTSETVLGSRPRRPATYTISSLCSNGLLSARCSVLVPALCGPPSCVPVSLCPCRTLHSAYCAKSRARVVPCRFLSEQTEGAETELGMPAYKRKPPATASN
jgi:hypothetical protein